MNRTLNCAKSLWRVLSPWGKLSLIKAHCWWHVLNLYGGCWAREVSSLSDEGSLTWWPSWAPWPPLGAAAPPPAAALAPAASCWCTRLSCAAWWPYWSGEQNITKPECTSDEDWPHATAALLHCRLRQIFQWLKYYTQAMDIHTVNAYKLLNIASGELKYVIKPPS